MQRSFLIIALLAASAAQVRAQQGAPPPMQAPAYTKVGVVNMGIIYTQYQRVRTFKSEIERKAKPYKDKQAELQKLANDWTIALNNPNGKLTPQERETGQRVIVECKRKLEDLDLEFKRVFAKDFEDQMVLLNKDINDRIREFAGSHGYHLVLAFGEPETPLQGLADFRRRMQVIDSGGVTVAYYAPNLDISREVVESLNRSYTPPPTPQPGQPINTQQRPH